MDIFKDTRWVSAKGLVESIFNHSRNYSDDEEREIRRSWLVKDGPKLFEHIDNEHRHPTDNNWYSYYFTHYVQSWISYGPEVRIHRSYNSMNARLRSFICLKETQIDNEGFISIKKEFVATDEVYNKALNMICEDHRVKPFQGSIVIPIDLHIITYECDTKSIAYEVRCADNGNRTWIDIRFASEEEAKAFVMREPFIPFIDKEITTIPSESMRSYWYYTRLHPYKKV